MSKKPLISSLSMSFKRATLPESVEEAKKEHRNKLHDMIEQYAKDVNEGKAEGIRTAKELVEVMKMDLLLMGEATDRTEQNTNIDEVRVSKMSQYVDESDPAIMMLMDQMLMGLNNANDDDDIGSSKKQKDIAQAERERFIEEDKIVGEIDYSAAYPEELTEDSE